MWHCESGCGWRQASRLTICGFFLGQKPLTMYFLRRVQELYANRPQKELSPSFWDSEGKSPTNNEGLESIMAGIEHRLGPYNADSVSICLIALAFAS